jgi:hypothetical protein
VTKFGHLAKIFKTVYDEIVRKIYLNILSFFSFLIISFFLVTPSYAIDCNISVNPSDIYSNYNKNINIRSDDCNFTEGRTYTIILHPYDVTSGALYSNYFSYKKTPEDPRKIILNIDLNSKNVVKDNLGVWLLEICEKDNVSECANLGNIRANANMQINPVPDPKPTAGEPPASTTCAEYEGEGDNKRCILVSTAIGDISTKPAEFVQKIYSIVLGLAGGIALIMIILSGYKFMSSNGNPEKVKAAGEQLTSSIIGLVFIIFAFVILQIIGVDILRIPGFSD